MTFFAALFRNSLEDPQVPIGSSQLSEMFGGQATDAGVHVTERKALEMSAVWRSVNLIAGSIASLPLHAYESDGVGRVSVGDRHPAAKLLSDPHSDMTPFEYWELMTSHVILWGNGYAWLQRNSHGHVDKFIGLHPSRVRPGRTSDGTKVYAIDGGKIVATDADLMHIPGFSIDGIVGLSPIAMARQGIGLAMAAEGFGGRLFSSGSLASGVLETDSSLKPEQADAILARWKQKRAGLQHAHDPIILDNGAKFHQLTINPSDAQFLESRRFQISEIARMFGIPPHLLMDTEKSTSWGTGIEQQSISFVVYTLRPWLTRIEQRVTKVLQPNPIYARFTVEGLLRGDSKQRAEFYQTMWGLGSLSTNDIRALEELGPVDGGDVRYRPLNYGQLGTTDSANVTRGTTDE